MSSIKKYQHFLHKIRRGVAYWSQAAKRDFTDDVLAWMDQRKLSQSGLAEAGGVSPQFVTKVLRTNANLTIETMVKFAAALGCQVRIHLADRNAITEWRDRPADITRFTVQISANVVSLDFARIKATLVGGSTDAKPLAVNG